MYSIYTIPNFTFILSDIMTKINHTLLTDRERSENVTQPTTVDSQVLVLRCDVLKHMSKSL